MTSKNFALTIYRLYKSNQNVEALVEATVDYLKQKNLLYKLPHIVRQLEILERQDASINSLSLTLARKISSETEAEIKKFLNVPGSAEVKKDFNENLIGGFVATYRGKIFDASVSGQIGRLKTLLITD